MKGPAKTSGREARGRQAKFCRAAFGDMVDGGVTGEDVRATREALLDHCRLDTLAMVKVADKMRSLLGE